MPAARRRDRHPGRQTESGDSLETARPADLLVLLDSLQQREAALNTEVADLQRTLDALQASGSNDQAAIENAQARLAALSILIGTVAATGPGVTITIDDTAPGVSPETMLDVVNELRAAGAEAMQIRAAAVRRPRSGSGVDTWVVGAPGALVVDGTTLSPPYSVLAIGDPADAGRGDEHPRRGRWTASNGSAAQCRCSRPTWSNVTALRQPKPRQYAQPVK